MRKLVLTALAATAALGAVVATPSKADAQVAFSFGVASPGFGGGYYGPRHWGPRPWGHPEVVRPAGWGYGGAYGGYHAPRHRFYHEPVCFVRRVWVDTPWGPRPRPVRVCR